MKMQTLIVWVLVLWGLIMIARCDVRHAIGWQANRSNPIVHHAPASATDTDAATQSSNAPAHSDPPAVQQQGGKDHGMATSRSFD